jgi:DNA-binding FrmR family transcriptional regulator
MAKRTESSSKAKSGSKPGAAARNKQERDEPCPDCAPPIAGRKALGVDPEIKASNLRRLRRIEGQVRGLEKMVENDRYCTDVIVQVAAAQEALRGVARAIMRNHLKHCATQALTSGDPEQTEAMYDELLELIYKHLR